MPHPAGSPPRSVRRAGGAPGYGGAAAGAARPPVSPAKAPRGCCSARGRGRAVPPACAGAGGPGGPRHDPDAAQPLLPAPPRGVEAAAGEGIGLGQGRAERPGSQLMSGAPERGPSAPEAQASAPAGAAGEGCRSGQGGAERRESASLDPAAGGAGLWQGAAEQGSDGGPALPDELWAAFVQQWRELICPPPAPGAPAPVAVPIPRGDGPPDAARWAAVCAAWRAPGRDQTLEALAAAGAAAQDAALLASALVCARAAQAPPPQGCLRAASAHHEQPLLYAPQSGGGEQQASGFTACQAARGRLVRGRDECGNCGDGGVRARLRRIAGEHLQLLPPGTARAAGLLWPDSPKYPARNQAEVLLQPEDPRNPAFSEAQQLPQPSSPGSPSAGRAGALPRPERTGAACPQAGAAGRPAKRARWERGRGRRAGARPAPQDACLQADGRLALPAGVAPAEPMSASGQPLVGFAAGEAASGVDSGFLRGSALTAGPLQWGRSSPRSPARPLPGPVYGADMARGPVSAPAGPRKDPMGQGAQQREGSAPLDPPRGPQPASPAPPGSPARGDAPGVRASGSTLTPDLSGDPAGEATGAVGAESRAGGACSSGPALALDLCAAGPAGAGASLAAARPAPARLLGRHAVGQPEAHPGGGSAVGAAGGRLSEADARELVDGCDGGGGLGGSGLGSCGQGARRPQRRRSALALNEKEIVRSTWGAARRAAGRGSGRGRGRGRGRSGRTFRDCAEHLAAALLGAPGGAHESRPGSSSGSRAAVGSPGGAAPLATSGQEPSGAVARFSIRAACAAVAEAATGAGGAGAGAAGPEAVLARAAAVSRCSDADFERALLHLLTRPREN